MKLRKSNGAAVAHGRVFKLIEGEGSPAAFTCPECSGPIREIKASAIVRFRCAVGHAFSADAMLAGRLERLETELWHLVSSTDESRRLALMMAAQSRKEGLPGVARELDRCARECRAQSEILQRLLREVPASSSVDRIEARRKA